MIFKKVAAVFLAASMVVGSLAYAFADGANVVTLAADLTPQQKATMLKYFGTDESSAQVINVNNQDERKYLTGVAPESQIGTKTYSCAYIQPASEGTGVKVRTANLTYVTAGMISSTLITAGVKDANVLAAAPFKVSGTGALTGCFLAFEKATGDTLDEEKKELATEEIVVTGGLGSQYSPEQATGMVNDMKAEVIKNGTSDKTQIADVINNVSNNYNITLTQDNKEDLEKLLTAISAQNYNYDEVKSSLTQVSEGVNQQLHELGVDAKPMASGIVYNIKNFFVNIVNHNDDLGILEETNDAALGASAVIDSTEESLRPVMDEIQSASFWEKVKNWVLSLVGKEPEQPQVQEPSQMNETEEYMMPEDGSMAPEGEVNLEDGVGQDAYQSPYPEKAPDTIQKSEMGLEED